EQRSLYLVGEPFQSVIIFHRFVAPCSHDRPLFLQMRCRMPGEYTVNVLPWKTPLTRTRYARPTTPCLLRFGTRESIRELLEERPHPALLVARHVLPQ